MKSTQYVNPQPDSETLPSNDKPVVVKSWDEFRKTGLFLFVNQFLHIFGWALVLECDKNNSVTSVKPARVVFRGFDEKSVSEDHIKLADYIANNAEQLKIEANS